MPVMVTTPVPSLPAEAAASLPALRRAGSRRKRESLRLVPTGTTCDTTLGGISPDFQWMLDSLDERIQAFEMSEGYHASLTGAEWLALRETVTRNGIPLRFV